MVLLVYCALYVGAIEVTNYYYGRDIVVITIIISIVAVFEASSRYDTRPYHRPHRLQFVVIAVIIVTISIVVVSVISFVVITVITMIAILDLCYQHICHLHRFCHHRNYNDHHNDDGRPNNVNNNVNNKNYYYCW